MASEKTLRLQAGRSDELLERASHLSGSALALLMAGVDVEDLDGFDSVEAVAAWGRVASWAQARQAEAAARVERHLQDHYGPGELEGEDRQRSISPDSRARKTLEPRASRDLAMRLGWTRRAAAHLIATGLSMQGPLQATAEALEEGRICWRKATVMADGLRGMALPVAIHVEDAVLPSAPGRTPNQLARDVAREVIDADPEGAVSRHEQARAGRRVTRPQALPDGMARISAILPADAAVRIDQALTSAVRRARGSGEPRTSDQLRADSLVAALGSGQHLSGTAGASINVTVPWHILVGEGADRAGVAHLEGYGAIDPLTARAIAAGGVWRRLVTDPLSGAVLDVGRSTYRPPAGVARSVRARDGTCTRPGCTVSAENCELDHITPFSHGGATSAENLAALCPADHRAKSRGEFSVSRNSSTGVITWTSPTGHRYRRDPAGVTTINGPPGPASNESPSRHIRPTRREHDVAEAPGSPRSRTPHRAGASRHRDHPAVTDADPPY
ncbi:HNH endonuclease signature motif containing protein [Bogoriella caseilytica]|uniref:HNH endonuclease n=1 Tax=Bogoriella caseilytica TaxID=56055 RepID=A0A3N2B931_9MICO|nr:HNH endonuclease signature motif containing protein [Bogoriella caseilytica]ROR71750.1 HNH endonuclease [Bogoriella caseilytica]